MKQPLFGYEEAKQCYHIINERPHWAAATNNINPKFICIKNPLRACSDVMQTAHHPGNIMKMLPPSGVGSDMDTCVAQPSNKHHLFEAQVFVCQHFVWQQGHCTELCIIIQVV